MALLLVMGLPVTQCLREDEVECEEAVAHLAECCPDFERSAVQCAYIEGCDSDTHPHLSPRESECIIDSECETLQDDEICRRAVERSAYRRRIWADQDAAPPPSDLDVCP